MSPADRPVVPPPTAPLNFWTKLAFGAGDLGPAMAANLILVFQLIFFTNVAGIPIAIAGSILMVSKIWDAINDPIIGILTDKTRSQRWGRRLPWLLYGAIPFGLFFFLLWIVPGNLNHWVLVGYYVLVGLCFQICYTVVNLPYTAMTPELTQDYDERTQLNSFRFAFSIGGSIASVVLALIVFNSIPESQPQLQYLLIAALTAVIGVLALYGCVWGTRQQALAFEARRQAKPTAALPFKQQFQIVLSNRPFLFVIGIYLCSWLALQVTATIIPYFVVVYMEGLKQPDVPFVIIAVQGTAMLLLFVWTRLSAKVGKKAVYFMGMSLWIIAQIGLFLLQPDQIVLMYILAIIAGFGVSTAYLIPWSMVPDVIELDELQTGQRREGVFYGFMVLLQKFGLAFGLFLVGLGLQAAGFQEALPGEPLPPQPASAVTAIRWVIGPLPTFSLLCGLVLTYFYPITRQVHAEIRLKLAEQRSQDT